MNAVVTQPSLTEPLGAPPTGVRETVPQTAGGAPEAVPATVSPSPAKGTSGTRRRSGKKITCQDCFFFQHNLCALDHTEPCPTFREAHPDGLRPPAQLSFAFRIEGRPMGGLRQSAFATYEPEQITA